MITHRQGQSLKVRMKTKTQFVCNQCAAVFKQWAGQCAQCGGWNSIAEEGIIKTTNPRSGQWANQRSQITAIEDVVMHEEQRMNCGLSELNRVLGGGLVYGSVVLIGVSSQISRVNRFSIGSST